VSISRRSSTSPVLNSYNLRCQGCWVDVDKPQVKIDLDKLNRDRERRREHGNSSFGILGGEPFLHPDLFDFLAQHPDCFFQIFTNGQLITPKKARLLRLIGNSTPLVSIRRGYDRFRRAPGQQGRLRRTLRDCRIAWMKRL